MPNQITLVSENGQWKAELKAWKNYIFFYASIGTEVTVYHRQQTKNVWGHTVTDWVESPTAISITNTYKGSLNAGGMGSFVKSGQFNASHAELKEFALGFFVININIDTGEPSPGPQGAILSIDAVEGRVSVNLGGEIREGVVTASSILSDNSIWG